jgi:hypothetical protein
MTVDTAPPDASRAEPVYWFVLWESAIERGEYAEAAAAAVELRRLGIRVTWANPAKGSEVPHGA